MRPCNQLRTYTTTHGYSNHVSHNSLLYDMDMSLTYSFEVASHTITFMYCVGLIHSTNSSTSQPITITAEGLSLNCDENKVWFVMPKAMCVMYTSRYISACFFIRVLYFKTYLISYIQRSYGYNVTINASDMECVNKFKGIYKIKIITISAASLNEILPLL